ncbi:glutathione synthase [Polychytrium aggregatum]|uniref:glutathione synthase n=1 Tax=Polychytrium aggregatum TaxID=110093 RepID=UPI0022FEFD82|nr:glutathione synthase [Polychytrium aggregatum]KAI9204173.1 glutathione synthase [Polychytrium aggregatum]
MALSSSSSSSYLPDRPPPLTETQLQELRDHAVDWSLVNGLVLRPALASVNVTHAPFALFPSPFPRAAYEQVVKLQPLFNSLVHAIAQDDKFIREIMEDLSKVDDFVEQVYEIYKAVSAEGSTQPVTLGLHRSDYLLHVPSGAPSDFVPVPQQVELNTIASSFSSLSSVVSELHRFLAERTNYFNSPSLPTPDITVAGMPENASRLGLPKALAKAWQLYDNKDAVVVMVVQPGERNAFDQRWIEYTLFKVHHIKLVRKTLAEIDSEGTLVGDERTLVIGKHEVAVTYFRSGYAPTDYPSGKGGAEWRARLLIERSKTIKCPNAAYHLVGTKKVQQILARPGVVERFLKNPVEAAQIRASFTGLYPLDSSAEGLEAVKLALSDPGRFVMKPQREGGGNNIYGQDIAVALNKLTPKEREAFILMDLIQPPRMQNVMVRNAEIIPSEVISELGIYGIWVSEGSVCHLNEAAGHLLRTKKSDSNEGGVAAGFAVIDSPLLL